MPVQVKGGCGQAGGAGTGEGGGADRQAVPVQVKGGRGGQAGGAGTGERGGGLFTRC